MMWRGLLRRRLGYDGWRNHAEHNLALENCVSETGVGDKEVADLIW